MELSLVVIAKNEAERIERCLASVPFATEKVVLDSGSTDGTPEVAEAAGARVIRTDWPGHVAQKNRGLEAATQPWVLSLDADEWLSEDAQREIPARLAGSEADGMSFPRCSCWLGTELRHGRWYPDRRIRLVRRGKGTWVGDDPHDRLEVSGTVERLKGDILHVPYRDLSHHLDTIDRYTRVAAHSLHSRGVRARWWDVVGRPPAHFVNAFWLRRGFLDGVPGFAVATLGSTYVMCKWLRLWQVQQRREEGG